MTVYPGSLDHLYYNGVIECIPYEAYTMPVNMQYSAQVNPYANYFQSEKMINNYGIGADSFMPSQDRNNKKKMSPIIKGLLAGSVLLTTLVCILKGKPKKI